MLISYLFISGEQLRKKIIKREDRKNLVHDYVDVNADWRVLSLLEYEDSFNDKKCDLRYQPELVFKKR